MARESITHLAHEMLPAENHLQRQQDHSNVYCQKIGIIRKHSFVYSSFYVNSAKIFIVGVTF